MPAPAIYYGLNALSNNMIMADRKRLRTPNGVILGTPGSGLILFDNVVIPFVDKYPTDTKTYRIMNTKPEESVQKEDAV